MAEEGLRLYSYWRSSASYRIRIALNLKQLEYEIIPVHLTRDGGEQNHKDFRALNPQRRVPVLVDGYRILRQSLAIMEYLDDAYPEIPLLPPMSRDRVRVRMIAHTIASDVQPLVNLSAVKYLEDRLGVNEEDRQQWMMHWITQGLDVIEEMLTDNPSTGQFCEGDMPSQADVCLVPQLYTARRYDIKVDRWPEILRIEQNCLALPAFRDAMPENQPDAE